MKELEKLKNRLEEIEGKYNAVTVVYYYNKSAGTYHHFTKMLWKQGEETIYTKQQFKEIRKQYKKTDWIIILGDQED